MTSAQRPPNVAELLDWLEGRLEPPAADRVAAQADDPRVSGMVNWLRGFLETARAMPLHEPPPLVRQNLRQHFARWSAARAVLQQAPPVFPAKLTFDSRRDLALAGARAADTADETIHLAYETDVADLVLDVHPLGGGRFRVDGQVLVSEPGSAPVFRTSVHGEHFEARTVDGDELGRFSLPDVPVDVHELRATNGEIAIVADLDLKG